MASSSALAQRFAALRQQLEHTLPDIDAGNRLDAEFEAPRVRPLSVALERELTPEECRRLLFFPDPSDMPLYSRLLHALPSSMPEGNPRRGVQVTFMGLLYMVHQHAWPLVEAFITSGGLRALLSLFTRTQVRLQSQAVDCLLQITAHPGFDWFAPPDGARAMALHRAMLDLAAAPPGTPAEGAADATLVGACIANAHAPAPGTSYFCLQLLAFWLSWARKLHTKDGQLTVTQPLLDALAAWGTGAAAGAGAAAAPASGHIEALAAPSSDPTERQGQEAALAAKLHADFSRHAVEGTSAGLGAASQLQAPQGAPEAPATAPRASQPALDALTACEAAKLAGNAAYTQGKGAVALRQYTAALAAAADAHSAAVAGAESGDGATGALAAVALSTQCTLASNVAAVFLRIARLLAAEEAAAAAPPTVLQPFEGSDSDKPEAVAAAAKSRAEAVGAGAAAPATAADAAAACVAAAFTAVALQGAAAGSSAAEPCRAWLTAAAPQALTHSGALLLPYPWEASRRQPAGSGLLPLQPLAADWDAFLAHGASRVTALKSLLRAAQALRLADVPQAALQCVVAALALCSAGDASKGEEEKWAYLQPQLVTLKRELDTEVALLAPGGDSAAAPEVDMAAEVMAALLGGGGDIGAGLEEAEAEFERAQARAAEPAAATPSAAPGLGGLTAPRRSLSGGGSGGVSATAVATAVGLGGLQAATQGGSKAKRGKKSKKGKGAALSSLLAGF